MVRLCQIFSAVLSSFYPSSWLVRVFQTFTVLVWVCQFPAAVVKQSFHVSSALYSAENLYLTLSVARQPRHVLHCTGSMSVVRARQYTGFGKSADMQ